MTLLTPLGLIALSGIIILIIIYLIKPSYQSKLLPSTYIWKESLKYKTAERPTSKLRNILIIICQILIIATVAMIVSTPFVEAKAMFGGRQDIIIIDGSASMNIETEGESRFDRAKSQIKEYAKQSIKDQNDITIILAGNTASYIAKNERDLVKIEESLNNAECDLAIGDIEGAMKLAREQNTGDRLTKIDLYTSAKYENIGEINVIDVSGEDDWNAAILDVRAEMEENFYEFEVDIAASGKDKYINVIVNITDVNDKEDDIKVEKRVNCTEGNTVTVDFKDLEIYSYNNISVSIIMDDGTADSFAYDDQFYLFGGKKETLNIQYYSLSPNNFFSGALFVLKDKYKDIYDINISAPTSLKDVKDKGFDLYIYEHTTPEKLPTDGIVFLANPDKLPTKMETTLKDEKNGEFTFKSNTAHPIMKYVQADKITAVKYKPIETTDFEKLMYCENDCVFAVKDSSDVKMAILTLDLNYSNLPMIMEFPLMLNNMFEYFLHPTIEDNIFDTNSDIDVNARGENVLLIDGENKNPIDSETTLRLDKVGQYSIEQTLLSKKKITKDFFVKIPTAESNTVKAQEEISGLFEIQEPQTLAQDMLVYFAAALLLLVCLERFLHSLENV